MPSRDTAAACDPSSLKCMPSHPPMPPFDVWRDRDWQGSHRARDSRAQPAPKPVEGCGIAMFAGNVQLPCDAARIPAAQCRRDLSCPCKSTTCNRCALACDLHHSIRNNGHVDSDHIRYGHRPYSWQAALSMTPDTHNSRRPRSASDTYHHGDLPRALVQAALELAAEDKDWNFSLREVARRAGVSHNAPYNHFPHKRDLLDAAAAAGHDLL